MLDRILITVLLIGLGVAAYRLALSMQRQRVLTTAGRRGAPLRPALLIFTSPTCAPCKLQQLPIVERLKAGWVDRAPGMLPVDVRVIDVMEQPDAASQFGVWSLPTTIVLDAEGQVAAINLGVTSEQKLREQIERAAETTTRPAPSHVAQGGH